MNFKKITLPLILSLSFLFVACQESTQTPDNGEIESELEETGEDVDNAIEDAGEATEEGIKEAGDAIEEAGDSVEDATN